MDRQTRSYIFLGAGLLALVFVVCTVTLPGFKRVKAKEAAHKAEHQRVEKEVKSVQEDMASKMPSAPKLNIGNNGRVTVAELPLRTAPPANPFRVEEEPTQYRAPKSGGRLRTVESIDIPSGPAPSMYSGPKLMVPPAPVVAAEPELPVLKGVVTGKDRLAVLHFDGKTLYAKVGDRISDQWKVLRIYAESVTLAGESGHTVRVAMKGDQ